MTVWGPSGLTAPCLSAADSSLVIQGTEGFAGCLPCQAHSWTPRFNFGEKGEWVVLLPATVLSRLGGSKSVVGQGKR